MAIPGSITNATNTAPIVITTSGAHGFSDNDIVLIDAVGGNTAANGTWFISVVDATHFTLDAAAGNGDYTSGGTATKITLDPDTANVIKHETTITGTGTVTLGSVVSGYLPASTLDDETQVNYRIETVDGSDVFDDGDWEEGVGNYDKDAGTVTRDAVSASSAALGDDLSPAKVAFSDGNKTIKLTVRVGDPASPPADPDFFVALPPPPGDPSPICKGVLVGASAAGGAQNFLVRSDGDRIFTSESRVILTPAGTGISSPGEFTGAILLRYATELVVITRRVRVSGYCEMPLSRIGDAGRRQGLTGGSVLDLSQPSIMPFTKNANKLPDQDHAYSGRPLDVFAYARLISASTGPNWTAPEVSLPYSFADGPVITSGSLVYSLRLFYLNWYSGTARNNGNSGAPVGHELYVDGEWVYLDTQSESGWSSDWITDTRYGYKDKKMYLYLGTIVPNADNQATCRPGYRGVHNQWKRFGYTDTTSDTTAFWDFAPVTESGQDWQRMNASNINQNDPLDRKWRHLWINPRGQASSVPRAGMTANGYGNQRVKMVSYIDWGSGLADFPLVLDSNASTQAITPDLNNELSESFSVNFNPRWITAQEPGNTWRKGANVYEVYQARGSGAGTVPNPRTKRFWGAGRPMVLGDPNIVFPGGPQPANAGAAGLTVVGEC